MILFSQGVSYSGFLWDSSSGIDLKDAAVLESPVVNGNGNHTYPRLYLAHFCVSIPQTDCSVHANVFTNKVFFFYVTLR